MDAAMNRRARSRLTNNPSTRYLIGFPSSGTAIVPAIARTTAATAMDISGDLSLILLRTNAATIIMSSISVNVVVVIVTSAYFENI